MNPVMTMKAGREKSLRQRHPWIFSGAVSRVDGVPEPGESVQVVSDDGTPLGTGAFSPESQIRVLENGEWRDLEPAGKAGDA